MRITRWMRITCRVRCAELSVNISRAYKGNNRLFIPLIFVVGAILTACSPLPPLPTIAVLPTYALSSTPSVSILPTSTAVPLPKASTFPAKSPPTLIPTITPTPTLQIEVIQPTDLQPPSVNQVDPRVRSPLTDTPLPREPDRVWAEQTLGSSKLTISFFSREAHDCVRLTIREPAIPAFATAAPDQSTEACATSPDDVVIGVQTTVLDSSGRVYTVLAGRAFSERVTAISSEFDDAADTHADVTDHGFVAVLDGKHTAWTIIPIDQFGNLVGRRFLFQ